MPAAALRQMTVDEFLEWSLEQEDRYELVDGKPVLMGDWGLVDGREVFMAGAKTEHDIVVVNVISELRVRLRGKPCRPSSADMASLMTRGNVRRPDVTIDCKRPAPGATLSAEPLVFFEVLSRSTRSGDFIRKGDEYRNLPSLLQYVIIEPLHVHVLSWSRADDGSWGEPDEWLSLDDVLPLPVAGVELPLAEIYADVPLLD